MLTSRHVALAGCLLLVGGCTGSDASRTITASEVTPVSSLSAEAGRSAEEVAQAFALALARPEVRTAVRDAMRSSQVTEHKLVLQEFVATPAGRHLVRVAAGMTDQSVDELGTRISLLPPLDFYAPFREHRTSWRATPEVLVGAIARKETNLLRAYATDGSSVMLDGRTGTPSRTLLVLTPAERKSLRIDPQPDEPGAVIQEPRDGETSGSLEWVGRDGRVRSVPLAHLQRRGARPAGVSMDIVGGGCDATIDTDNSCADDGAGGFPAGADTTFLDFLRTSYTDGAFDGSCELEFTTTYFRDGQEVGRGKLRREGVHPFNDYYLHSPMLAWEIRQGTDDRLHVNIRETDLLFDDNVGGRDFFDSDKSERVRIVHSWLGATPDTTKLEIDWYR